MKQSCVKGVNPTDTHHKYNNKMVNHNHVNLVGKHHKYNSKGVNHNHMEIVVDCVAAAVVEKTLF